MKKSYDSKFKSRVALEALRGELTVAGIVGNTKSSQIRFSSGKRNSWKELPRFSSPRPSEKESKPYTEDDLMRKIGRLEIENKCVLGLRLESRKAQISDQNPDLSVNHQLKLLRVPHSSFYHKSRREISRTASDERVKDEMLEIYMKTPFCHRAPENAPPVGTPKCTTLRYE